MGGRFAVLFAVINGSYSYDRILHSRFSKVVAATCTAMIMVVQSLHCTAEGLQGRAADGKGRAEDGRRTVGQAVRTACLCIWGGG